MKIHPPETEKFLGQANIRTFRYYLTSYNTVGKNLRNDKNYYEEISQKSKEGNIFYSKENVQKMWHKFYDECVKYRGNANDK